MTSGTRRSAAPRVNKAHSRVELNRGILTAVGQEP